MKSQLRLVSHELIPGAAVVEIWFGDTFVGTVTGADGAGVRIMTKHKLEVEQNIHMHGEIQIHQMDITIVGPFKPTTLEFIAEPLESLRARFPKCLEKLWVLTEHMEDRPGMYRDYTFDFESGLRLLVSRGKQENEDHDHIHVSASWEKDIPIGLSSANKQVKDAFKSLGGEGELAFIGMSIHGIPHWMVVKPNPLEHKGPIH